VSLYWWKDVYELAWWFSRVGIDPKKSRKPVVIVGGQGAANPRPLIDLCHYAFIGDGEATIDCVIRAIASGDDPTGIPGVYSPSGCEQAIAPMIPTDIYIENRKSKITRIELARGCKSRCPFCQLAFTKPYREQDFSAVEAALRGCPTKSVALFAPNRTSYSRLSDVDDLVVSLGKHNTGSDTRLDMIRKFDRIDCVRFGCEAFGERTRKKMHKIPTNKALIDGLVYVASELKNLQGEPMGSATCYMIGDLPGETRDDVEEFWDTLSVADSMLGRKFTLFLSVSSFVPAPHTPMWGCAINPYADWSHISNYGLTVKGRGGRTFKNLVIACRGGMAPAPARLAQMITVRGDEKVAPVIGWLAGAGKTSFVASGRNAWRHGKRIEGALRQVGFDPEYLYKEIDEGEDPPWSAIKPTITFARRWG